MKKKYLLMIVAALLLCSTAIGGTMAALDTETSESAVASISVKNIQVTAAGTKIGEFEIAKDVTPGGDLEYPLWVENSGNGYDIYVKVELYKSWTSDKSSEELDSAMGIIYGNAANNGWLVQYEDEEQMVLYYKYPLKATTEGEANKSTNFMDGIRFDKDMNNAYADATMTIDYTVTAVQANNSQDAMAAEWGMFPVFDSDGTLLNVYETRAEAEAARTALNN